MISRIVAALVDRRRLWVTAAVLLTAVGAVAWLSMPRQEDPRLPGRFATLVVPFPGADALAVERLVVDPLEDQLAEVDEVAHVRSTARTGVAVVVVELSESVYDTDPAWADTQDAIDEAARDFPPAVGVPDLNEGFNDAESVVVMITGSDDEVVLDAAADEAEDRLLAVAGVSKVLRAGAPATQITVALDGPSARRLGIGPRDLARQLDGNNQTIPGGSIRVDGRTLVLRPQGELRTLDELRQQPVVLPSGAAVPLSEVATVSLEAEAPVRERVRHDGRAAVAVSVVPRARIDLVSFGDRVMDEVDALRSDLAPLQVEVFADQPTQVARRISSLGFSLLLGIGIVAGFLFITMGARLGAVVSAVVPLVALTTVALYAMGGGTLQQLSIAALVIALGLLVDNAIVVAEAVQAHLDDGKGRWEAATAAVGELAIPLATATGTTLAAFVPMLLSPGVTADFTRSIPIVIMVALAISYVYAVLVTPVLSGWLLTARPKAAEGRLDRLGQRLASWATGRPGWVLAGASVLVLLAGGTGLLVNAEFFPYADRARFVATLEFPEGTDLDETSDVTRRLENWAAAQPGVVGVDAFVGRSAPRFYYNIQNVPRSPHRAQVVLTTETPAQVPDLVQAVREFGRSDLPEALVTARQLQQGPPTGSPVEIRLKGEDLVDLEQAADQVAQVLRGVRGAEDVSHDLGLGVPTLEVEVHDAAAGRRRLSRADVSLALLGQTRGIDVQPYRAGDSAIAVRVRGPAGQDTSAMALVSTDVRGLGSAPVALQAVASPSLRWVPSAIRHDDGERTVTVSSELAGGATFSEISSELQPALDALALPAGVDLEVGGEAESAGDANSALLGALPLGGLLLLGCLLLEFNSFRRVAIVLVTVPLAGVGVLPGLVLAGQPFGFMSLLGVIALVGIVVNNAIVLLDVVDHGLAQGLGVADAVSAAVRQRLRPILLTTGTTVAGLLPLALSSSTLWPPLASAMISGLLASTVLTLLVVPALSRLLLAPGRTR